MTRIGIVTLLFLATATAFSFYVGRQTGTEWPYWMAASSACFFFFVLGTEMWRKLADDAIDMLQEYEKLADIMLAELKRRRGGGR